MPRRLKTSTKQSDDMSKTFHLVLHVPSSRRMRVAMGARLTQISCSAITFTILAIGTRSENYYWDPSLVMSGLWSSFVNIVLGSLGLTFMVWPDKLHWHVMTALDLLAVADGAAALGCTGASIGSYYATTLPIAGTIFALFAFIGNFILFIQTLRKHFRITVVSRDLMLHSAAAKNKSVDDDDEDDEDWPRNIRPYDLETQYVDQPADSRNLDASFASRRASQDITACDLALDKTVQPASLREQTIDRESITAETQSSSAALSLSDAGRWSITSGTLTGVPSIRSTAPSWEK